MGIVQVRGTLAVLFAVFFFLLGGCVTVEKTEQGTKFFGIEKKDSWEKFRASTVSHLKEGRGVITMSDVGKLLPPPAVERDTGDLKAWGWYFHENRNRSWDLAVVNGSSGADTLYLLTVVFTEKGILQSYEEQRAIVPAMKRAVTSRPLINELVTYQNMLILDRLIEGSLNRAADRAVDRADQRFNATIDQRGAELADKVKSSVNDANNNGGTSYTVNTTTQPGSSGTSTTITVH